LKAAAVLAFASGPAAAWGRRCLGLRLRPRHGVRPGRRSRWACAC